MRKLYALTFAVAIAAPVACKVQVEVPTLIPIDENTTLGARMPNRLCRIRPTPYACTTPAHRFSKPVPASKYLCCVPAGLCVEITEAAECPYTTLGMCPDGSVMDHGDGIFSCDD